MADNPVSHFLYPQQPLTVGIKSVKITHTSSNLQATFKQENLQPLTVGIFKQKKIALLQRKSDQKSLNPANYSPRWIASEGQTEAQVPHSVQTSGSIL